jgi:GMP synthase-like glutamine amidotransferase
MASFCILNCDDAKAWAPINFGHMFQTCLCSDCDCCTINELARDKEMPQDIMSFDAVVITGSRYNCRDAPTLSWFEPLCNFIRTAAKKGSPRIYGGCFGCQVVAHALGGEVGMCICVYVYMCM